MKKKRWIVLGIVLLLLLGLLSAWFFRPKPSDKELIAALVEEVRVGIETKQLSKVMSNVSADYNDSADITFDTARLFALKMMRNTDEITVVINNYEEPKIEGNLAHMKLSVEITAKSGNQTVANLKPEITLILRKEKKGWRILNTEGWQQWKSQYFDF